MPESVDIAALAARLERLETAEAAREVTWRYATAVDTVDFELLAVVFAEHGSLTTRRGTIHGRDSIVAYYRPALADPVGRKHFLANQKVTWTAPGRATVESYFLFTYAGNGSSTIGWGNYVDTVEVVDGVGSIVDKTISIDVHADSREGWGGETE